MIIHNSWLSGIGGEYYCSTDATPIYINGFNGTITGGSSACTGSRKSGMLDGNNTLYLACDRGIVRLGPESHFQPDPDVPISPEAWKTIHSCWMIDSDPAKTNADQLTTFHCSGGSASGNHVWLRRQPY